MNTRLLGTLCMLGCGLQIADGVRWATLHLETTDTISLFLDILLSLGGICGLMGLLALKATGTNRVFQVLTFLPLVGFLGNIIDNILILAQISGPGSILNISSGLLVLAGMIVVGILTIAAKRLSGWRRFVPLLTSVMFPLALLVRSATQTTGLISIFMGTGWALLGLAVLTSSTKMVKQEAAHQLFQP